MKLRGLNGFEKWVIITVNMMRPLHSLLRYKLSFLAHVLTGERSMCLAVGCVRHLAGGPKAGPGCVIRDSNLGYQLLLPPANCCPIFASRTTQECPRRSAP